MNTRSFPRTALLAGALLLAIGSAAAQSSTSGRAKAVTADTLQSASGEAQAARGVARDARQAAIDAAAVSRGTAATPEGEAAARYHAYVADQASRRAQASTARAVNATNDVAASHSAASGGTAQPTGAILAARQDGRRAQAASLDAQQATAEAMAAARAASEAMSPPPPAPVETVQLLAQPRQVTIVSRMPGYPSTERQVVLSDVD